jgi:heme A synthase
MRKVFAGLAALVMLAVVVQVFLAASGAFDTAPKDESFAPHRALGYVILLLALVLTVLAALARMPGRLIGMSGLVAGLVILQALIAGVADALGDTGSSSTAGKIVFGLHGVNALVIMFVLSRLLQRARAVTSGAPAAGSPAAGAAAGKLS